MKIEFNLESEILKILILAELCNSTNKDTAAEIMELLNEHYNLEMKCEEEIIGEECTNCHKKKLIENCYCNCCGGKQ